jgi:hypothetical protein
MALLAHSGVRCGATECPLLGALRPSLLARKLHFPCKFGRASGDTQSKLQEHRVNNLISRLRQAKYLPNLSLEGMQPVTY